MKKDRCFVGHASRGRWRVRDAHMRRDWRRDRHRRWRRLVVLSPRCSSSGSAGGALGWRPRHAHQRASQHLTHVLTLVGRVRTRGCSSRSRSRSRSRSHSRSCLAPLQTGLGRQRGFAYCWGCCALRCRREPASAPPGTRRRRGALLRNYRLHSTAVCPGGTA